LLVLLCASNWVIIKEAEASSPVDPEAFTALRFFVAALAFTPWLVKGVRDRSTAIAGLELGLWSALGYLTQAEGLLTTDASRASFLSTFSVVTVPMLAGLDGNPVSLTTWACAGSAILGVFFLENGGAPPSWGDAWSLASAVFFAIQIYRTEARTKSVPEDRVLPLLAVIVAVVALITTGAAAARDPASVGRLIGVGAGGPGGLRDALAVVEWGPILYTGLFSTDAVLLLELVALRWVSSVDAAIVYTTEPVLGAIIAWVVLGERFGPKGFLGAAIILISALTTQLVGAGGGGGGGKAEEEVEKKKAGKAATKRRA
jgi:drug/metabolite transporter (DMT)-like permease